MNNHLNSKTVFGLLVILVIACTMAWFGKLSADLADVLKWVGTSYMGLRTVVNYMEQKNASDN